MPKPLSFDLRSRVLATVDAGLSCRRAAGRFGVSASSATRWAALRRAGGEARPKPQGGDRLSHRTQAHADLIHAALAEGPDGARPELTARWPGKGLRSAWPRSAAVTSSRATKDGARLRAGPAGHARGGEVNCGLIQKAVGRSWASVRASVVSTGALRALIKVDTPG